MYSKQLFRGGILGFLIGIAIQYILAIAISIYLKLGYLLPYPAALSEQFGGEMNAIVIVTAICGGLGAIAGIITIWIKARR